MNFLPSLGTLHARIFTNSVSFTDISTFGVEGMTLSRTGGWLYQPCDVAVMYGLANAGRRSLQGQLRNAIYREHLGPIVVIESCLFGRQFKPYAPDWLTRLWPRQIPMRQVHPYFRVAVGGALGDDADFCARHSPPDRWEQQSRELGIGLAPYRRDGRHVVILGQMGRDASLRGTDIATWLGATARAVRGVSDRPIIIRLHPSMRLRDRRAALVACDGIAGLSFSPPGRSFAADMADAWTCVTYSSGGAIDALLAGVPPICLSSASLAYRLCSRTIDEVENPLMPPREQFFHDLAYSQWTPRELADGTAWRHLLPAIYGKLQATAAARAAQRRSAEKLATPRRRRLALQLEAVTLAGRMAPRLTLPLRRRAALLMKLGHVHEAQSSYESLYLMRRKDPGACRGWAEAAEKTGSWREAQVAWRALDALQPGTSRAIAGLARTALRAGDLDAAQQACLRLRAAAPDNLETLILQERVLTQRGELAAACDVEAEIWSRFGDAGAARRHVQTLGLLGRDAEAEQFSAALDPHQDRLAALLAGAQLAVQRHAWQQTIDLLAPARAEVLANWKLLDLQVTALRRLGRIDEAVALLDASTAGKHVKRARLRCQCLLEAGRGAEADAVLEGLWQRGDAAKLDAGLLTALVTAAQNRGGVALATSVLDDVTRRAPAPAAAALRLGAVFQRVRLDACEALEAGRLEAAPAEPEALVAAAINPSSPPAGIVLDITHALLRRRAAAPARCLLNAGILPQDALAVVLRLLAAAEQRAPFALVRLGDGEGSLLPYGPELAAFRSADLAQNVRTWWGGAEDVEAIEGEFRDAVMAADVVGLPDLDRTVRMLHAAQPSARDDNGRHLRGLLAAISFVETQCATATWTSCHIHQALEFWGLWSLLLPRLGPLTLITCHPQLGAALAQRHGARIAGTLLIPPERKYADAFAATSGDRHYPDTFTRLRETLSRPCSGQVFLVAAGVLGKIYCAWIRQAGGIAIDVGSAADHWCGHATRGAPDMALYRSPDGVADRLRSVLAREPRYAALLRAPGAGS